MSLNVRMKTFNNVKHLDLIHLKFGGSFFTCLAMLALKSKDGISSTIKENVLNIFLNIFICTLSFPYLTLLS